MMTFQVVYYEMEVLVVQMLLVVVVVDRVLLRLVLQEVQFSENQIMMMMTTKSVVKMVLNQEK